MPGSKSAYLERLLLDAVLGGQSFPVPTDVYLALFTTGTLDDDSTGSVPGADEVAGGSYARLTITNNLANFPAATGSGPATKQNGATFTFPEATADWGTVTQWALVDAATGGNILYFGSFDVPKAILTGDTASFPAGNLTITEQ